ncbi:MAG: hypothetical protein GEU90_23065, partial [Gemmatimonas sp.]|nr:hypothetical protein [Gemmatimonas sp.]
MLPTLVRNTLVLAAVSLAAACSDPISSGDYSAVSVRVTEDREDSRTVVRTIRNGSAVPITRHLGPCLGELHRREGVIEFPAFIVCIDEGRAPVEIA